MSGEHQRSAARAAAAEVSADLVCCSASLDGRPRGIEEVGLARSARSAITRALPAQKLGPRKQLSLKPVKSHFSRPPLV
jgi:hypothetical protein